MVGHLFYSDILKYRLNPEKKRHRFSEICLVRNTERVRYNVQLKYLALLM
jgi:hypothetical protein